MIDAEEPNTYMQYRTIGGSGISASAVCLGTWSIGGGPWWGNSDDAESIRTIQACLDGGINFIDTAPAYGFGRSEEVVGKAIQGRRDKAVIATKCGLWWHSDQGQLFFEQSGYTVRRFLKPFAVRKELELSLKRLKTDYVDLYITHWQEEGPGKTPIAETMECLMALKNEGKIRAIGASNTSVQHIEEYRRAGTLDAVQIRYTMLDRQAERELVPVCGKHGIGIMAYTVLEQGLLAGRIGMDTVFTDTEYRGTLPWMQPENRRKVLALLDGWKDLTAKYGCTLAQLVIAWTIAQPQITYALVGARKRRHAEENLRTGSLSLEPVDITRMRREVEALGQPE
jgi:methylglyoxal reductase